MLKLLFLESENAEINDTLALAIAHCDKSQWTMLLDLNGHRDGPLKINCP